MTSIERWLGALRKPVASAAALLAVAACGNGLDHGDEPVDQSSLALYGGEVDNDASSNNAIVALRIGDGSPFELCTGALVAPNLVLTARHCVSEDTADEIDCDEKGVSRNGPQVGADVPPRTIHVLFGPNPTFSSRPAANGKAIFRPNGTDICNSDIALVVLDRAIPDITPMAIRLSGTVRTGESLRAVGYGQNDRNVRLGVRFRKEGLRVLASGPRPRRGSNGSPPIGTAEFEVGRSICQGDSGGPAISETTGAIVGVVSRGVSCELDFGHIYTRTAGFNALFQLAFAEAGAAPIDEQGTPESPSRTDGMGSIDLRASQDPSAYLNAATESESESEGCNVLPGDAAKHGPSARLALALVALIGVARAQRERSRKRSTI